MTVPDTGPRLTDRLRAARERRFVGRERELAMVAEALDADAPPFALMYLYGPGGVGKTALLDAFARLAAGRGVVTIRLDGHAVDPSPQGVLAALRQAAGAERGTTAGEVLAGHDRVLLLVDTFERLAPLDAWLREVMLPELPARSIVVIAGRNPPAAAWRTDPGWSGLVRIVPLRNLAPEESRAYLHLRGVPADQHEAVLAFTHGHPLALSLVADVRAQGAAAGRIDDPDVIRVLLERFVEGTPGPLHRRALHVCAHARVTTEPLLADTLGITDAGEIFAWLRGLSFIEQGPEGLFPHDLARDVLDADLRWRNPGAYRDVHRRVREHVVRALQAAQGLEQQRAFFDLLYLHRHNPLMRPYVQWATLGTAWAEPATREDHPAIVEMVRHHEGAASAAIARMWLERQPEAFTVFRGSGMDVLGFIATLQLRDLVPEGIDADPALQAASDFARRYGPPRPGEVMLHHRFVMGRETYQAPSEVWDMVIMTTTVQWLTTPRLSWSFLPVADPGYWHDLLSYVNQRRAPEADFVVDGRHSAVFAHDWRTEPPLAWLDTMAERELLTTRALPQAEPVRPAPVVVLSEQQFADAVRQALRDFHRPEALGANPLLRSRLVAGRTDDGPVEALRDLLRKAAGTLAASPRDQRLYRAVHHTYLSPAPSQEAAAELLGLPFSTYRYHLAAGLKRMTAWLWRLELEGGEPA